MAAQTWHANFPTEGRGNEVPGSCRPITILSSTAGQYSPLVPELRSLSKRFWFSEGHTKWLARGRLQPLQLYKAEARSTFCIVLALVLTALITRDGLDSCSNCRCPDLLSDFIPSCATPDFQPSQNPQDFADMSVQAVDHLCTSQHTSWPQLGTHNPRKGLLHEFLMNKAISLDLLPR